MTRNGEELLEAVLHLERDERAELAARILDSIAPSAGDEEVERAWATEIDRRATRVLAKGPTGDSGDAVLERVQRNILRR